MHVTCIPRTDVELGGVQVHGVIPPPYCACRRAYSDNDHAGEVDQPPCKLQRTEAAPHRQLSLPPEANADSRQALDKHMPSDPRVGNGESREGLPCPPDAVTTQPSQLPVAAPSRPNWEESTAKSTGGQHVAEHSAMLSSDAKACEARAPSEQRRQGPSGPRESSQVNGISDGCRGLPLGAVVAACAKVHDRDSSEDMQVEKARVAGSRDSSQTRSEACGNGEQV